MSRALRFLPLGLGLFAWLPTLWLAGWALDDLELIFGNPVIDGSAPWFVAFERAYFDHLGAAGQWRPLASICLRISHALWSTAVAGYHLDNLCLHLVVVALATRIGLRKFQGTAWIFGLSVFAVHPALADVVAWISGRTSSLGACFGLAGALCALRSRSPLLVALFSCASVALASLAKEDGLLFAPLCVLLVLDRGRAQSLAALGGSLIAFIGIGFGRLAAIGTFMPRAGSPALGSASLSDRLLIGGHEWIEALRIGVFPFGYPPQYRADFLLARTDPLPDGLVAVVGWSIAIAFPVICFAIRGKSSRIVAGSALLAALAFLPVTQLVPLGEVFAPRFLYLPLLFAAPALGTLHAQAPRVVRCIAWTLVPLALVPLAWQRTTVYASRGAWRMEMLQHMPKDAASWNDLGIAREETGELESARDAYVRATELDPAYSRAWNNLGRLDLEQGQEPAALAHFSRAVSVGPRNAAAHANLGMLQLRRGDARASEVAYRRATEIAPGMVAAWRGLARALHAQGDLDGASNAIGTALELSPTDRNALDLRRRWTQRDH